MDIYIYSSYTHQNTRFLLNLNTFVLFHSSQVLPFLEGSVEPHPAWDGAETTMAPPVASATASAQTTVTAAGTYVMKIMSDEAKITVISRINSG